MLEDSIMFKYVFKHMFNCGNMTKTITIRTEVYEKLIRIKKENESFSELFERLAEILVPIDALLKLRGSMEFNNKDKMLDEILSKRSEVRQ